MAHITEEHLHHMARRHHATMQQLDTLREKVMSYAKKGYGVLETGAAAWAGGLLEGKTNGAALGGVLPYNLLGGIGFLVASNFVAENKDLGGERTSKHLENIGNGLIASYTSALGYTFGKRWRETGQAFGGGGRPFLHPYENGWPKGKVEAAQAAFQQAPLATAAGQWPISDPTPEQMAQLALQMQYAAQAPSAS